MAAVEADLLNSLLLSKRHTVVCCGEIAQLLSGARALVACCHGEEPAHLNSAIALGKKPLTVRRIVDERLGSALVLLSVCHAGETRDDAAGNALGLAAGFLLGGAKVVVGWGQSGGR